ncbi:alpha/beta hydrolase [Streptomyces malaysiensis]|uniref:Serine aminopeptidase S33 domain-containing protein n=1 Tax=Streptomyces malaysiensis TaxID=92644 RepID=A0A2J7YPB5_STRMQ|nr:alpha/beta fold hydrolase [Streptomyces malaysiensis]PNG89865.1 hypothetical protein SMF913_25330 [Streptomyces malaysiensis]
MSGAPIGRTVTVRDRSLRLWHLPPPVVRPGGAGRPVLLLHGGAYSTMAVFHHPHRPAGEETYSLLEALAFRGFDPYGLDFTGYGGSRSGDLVPEGMEWFLDDAASAARRIRARTGHAPIVLGWSWGAQVAAALAETPDVSGLIFWGGVWGEKADLVPEPLRALPRPAGPWRTNTREHALADFLTPGSHDPRVADAFAEHALRTDPRSPSASRLVFLSGLPLFDPRRIRHPALLVHGEYDPLAGRADHEALADALAGPGVAYRVVPGADHNIQFGLSRAVFFDLLRDFWGGAGSGGEVGDA